MDDVDVLDLPTSAAHDRVADVTVAASSYQTLGTQLPMTAIRNPRTPTVPAAMSCDGRCRLAQNGCAGTARGWVWTSVSIEEALPVGFYRNRDQRGRRADHSKHTDTRRCEPDPKRHLHHLAPHCANRVLRNE